MREPSIESESKKIAELEKLLVSIDWAQVHGSESLLSPGHVDAINDKLGLMFDDKTLQQFLYDTEKLKSISLRLQPLAMIASLRPGMLTVKATILLPKLLSHQAYSVPALWPLAVASLLETDRFLAGPSAAEIDSTAKKWYRMFVIDHAISRMYPANMVHTLKTEDEDKSHSKVEEKRDALILQFEGMIPAALKTMNRITDQALVDESDPLLLRAAHYYGHRGNQHLHSIQELKWGDRVREKNFGIVPDLVSSALDAYRPAIALRLLGFAKTFGARPKDLPVTDFETIESVSAWDPERKTKFESFVLTSQALADIANQYAAMSCVYCYLYVYEKHHDKREVNATGSNIKVTLAKAVHYWRKAIINGNREGVGEPYRIMARRRLSEHMAHLVSNAEIGYPVNHYDRKLDDREKGIFDRFREMLYLPNMGVS